MSLLLTDNLWLFFCLALLLRCLWIEVAHKHLWEKYIFLQRSLFIHYSCSPSLLNLSLTGTFLLRRASLDHEILFPLCQVFSSVFPGKTLFQESLSQNAPFMMSRSHPFFLPNKKNPNYMGRDPRFPVCFPFIPAGRSHLASWKHEQLSWMPGTANCHR